MEVEWLVETKLHPLPLPVDRLHISDLYEKMGVSGKAARAAATAYALSHGLTPH